MFGAPAIVSEQFELLSLELVGCSDGWFAGVLLFAEEESADLFGTHAIDAAITSNSGVSTTRSSGWVCPAVATIDFMLLMMP